MIFREALITDIPGMQIVRNSVKENMLSNPALVTDEDYIEFISKRGRGWVCISDDKVVGFAIADLVEHNVWALFVDPEFEKKGIGRRLHDEMMNWYFAQPEEIIWLGTAPGTRAESFYRKAGWKEAGTHGKGEIKFEYSAQGWKNNNRV
jgi:GNAT superfamily N-acetyltransferase